MVKGLDKFREYFSEHKDNYVIIGGTACDMALQGTDMPPRATDDIDMILIVENMNREFGQRFWEFISDGNYTTRQRKRGEGKQPVPELFRFIKPQPGFPVQIELLSHHPDILGEPTGFHLTPIPLGEQLSSLSAILMDEEFYSFTFNNSIIDNGLRIASPLCLICLKAKAFLNLTNERQTNPAIRSYDIRKHRDDVFKLLAMKIDPLTPIPLSENIKKCLHEYVSVIEQSLPNQSLKDSLKISDDEIRNYLVLMNDIFELK